MRRSGRDAGLFLDRMSLYAADLQDIIRQHFNQLLRIRPTVPAREVAQLQVLAHLQPESLRCSRSLVDAAGTLTLSFTVNSSHPYTVILFWGQSCHDLLQLVENEGPYPASGRMAGDFPAGTSGVDIGTGTTCSCKADVIMGKSSR